MGDKFNLGLYLPIEREKERALLYLNKTTTLKYKQLLFRLIDCAYDIQFEKHLDGSHLDILEQGMRQPLELVFDSYSGKYVSMLSHHFKEAEDIFIRMSNDKNSKVRFNSVTLLLCRPVDKISECIINKCINDNSSLVRKKVADICERLDYVKMVDLLEERYRVEDDESVKNRLRFSIKLLKDGYILKKEELNKYNLLVKTNEGMTGIGISDDDIREYSLENIIKQIKDKTWK
jgi:hypothetical protein